MVKTKISPIAQAVEPLRVKAIAQADDAAKVRIANVREELKNNDWNAQLVAPYPNSLTTPRAAFQLGVHYYHFVNSITERDETRPCSYTFDSPRYVKMSQNGVAKFYKQVVDDAIAHYDAYVAKLVGKIGECESAELTYRGDLWYDSDLTILKKDGTIEIWNTKVILNHSKYGVPFNQWPTRRIKS